MSDNKKDIMVVKSKRVMIRLEFGLMSLIETEADSTKKTVSEVIRDMLQNYFYSETHSENMLLASNKLVQEKVERVEKSLDLFERFFEFWVEHYFALTGDLPEDKQQRYIAIHRGEDCRDALLEDFKKLIKDKSPSLVNRIALEYFESNETEGAEL